MTAVLPNDLRAPFFRRQRWTRVKNVSGVVMPPFSVVLINGVASSSGEIVLSVTQPNAASTDFNWNGYMVTGPIAIGVSDTTNEGYATDLSEPGFVRYDGSGTPAQGQVWGPKHGQMTLTRYYFGFEILGGNTTAAGNNVTVARWTGVEKVLGKADGASTKGSGTITVSVYAGAVNSDADTTMNITGVGNEFANVSSGKYVWVTRNGETPYLTSAEC
jgi:hypothetical protein